MSIDGHAESLFSRTGTVMPACRCAAGHFSVRALVGTAADRPSWAATADSGLLPPSSCRRIALAGWFGSAGICDEQEHVVRASCSRPREGNKEFLPLAALCVPAAAACRAHQHCFEREAALKSRRFGRSAGWVGEPRAVEGEQPLARLANKLQICAYAHAQEDSSRGRELCSHEKVKNCGL